MDTLTYAVKMNEEPEKTELKFQWTLDFFLEWEK